MTQKEIIQNLRPGDPITIHTPMGTIEQMLVIENTKGKVLLQESEMRSKNKLTLQLSSN